MKTPTPETESKLLTVAQRTDRNYLPEMVYADFARKLERERDEARKELSAITAELALSKYHDDDSNITAIANLTRAAAERDQLRRVCDELAAAIEEHGNQMNENPTWTHSLTTSVQSYLNLPHVRGEK